MIGQTAAKTREHLQAFSGRLSAGLCKPARRFVAEALYGIAARGGVRLSEIGRALEQPVALAKTETRLSRNLARPELRRRVGQAVLAEGAGHGSGGALCWSSISRTSPSPTRRRCNIWRGRATAPRGRSPMAIGSPR
jgi:hypothetical protein